MASSSSSSSGNCRYDVFVSYSIPDVHRTILKLLPKQFNLYGISMFEGIGRGQTKYPELTQAIRKSRISIVVFSKNYASSSWCLDELLEILKCKKDIGQKVMTIFNGVNPSDVRNQTGEFGIAFNETCARKTEEEKQNWSQALEDVGNIDGEHFSENIRNWDEDRIEKVARDVLNELNTTSFRDLDNIFRGDFRNWENDSRMIKNIARDFANKIYIKFSRAFEDDEDQDGARIEQTSQDVSKRVNATVSQSGDIEQGVVLNEPSSTNKRKSIFRRFTGMDFFVVINLLLELASAVADQLSSTRKPYFTRISLAMSVLSVVLSILDLTYKIRANKACFRCKWPIPWFYYPSRGYKRIFGSFTDTVLLFCVVGGLVVSTINYSLIGKGKDGPIKVSIWPLFFAIGMVVAWKFREKPVISNDHSN